MAPKKPTAKESDGFFDYVKRLIDLAKSERLNQLQVGEVNIVIQDVTTISTVAIGFQFTDVGDEDDDDWEDHGVIDKDDRRRKRMARKKRKR